MEVLECLWRLSRGSEIINPFGCRIYTMLKLCRLSEDERISGNALLIYLKDK